MRRATDVGAVVIHIRVIDDRCLVIYVHPIARMRVVAVHVAVHHVTLWQEYPVVVGYAHVDVDGHPRTQWRPAVVATTAAPAHPSRSPFVSGHPRPAVVVVVYPAAVVERRPAPVVVRDPSVAVVGHGPVPVGHVGLETRPDTGNPNIAVFVIVDPIAVGRQFIIE